MIQTEVELTDGRKVKAYYLDEEDRKNFFTMWTRTSSAELRLREIEEKQDLILQAVDRSHIKPFLKKKLREYVITLDPTRSYRFMELLRNAPYKRFSWEILREFINEGLFVDRGSGWYRIK